MAKAVTTTKPGGSISAYSDDMSAASVPDFMKGDLGRGTENIGSEDMDMPRLKLMQGLSPELDAYDFLRPGSFFHTANEVGFGGDEKSGGIVAVPIFTDTRFILWRPRDDGGGILARADDAVHWSPPNAEFKVRLDKKDGGHEVTWRTAQTVRQSGLANWGTMNPNDPSSPPAATRMLNVVFAFPEHPELLPAVVTFQRASIGQGRKFFTKLKTTRIPPYATVFRLTSFKDSNSKGDQFFNIGFQGIGRINDENLFNQYKAMHAGLTEAGLRVRDIESMQDEYPTGGGDADDGKDDGRPTY